MEEEMSLMAYLEHVSLFVADKDSWANQCGYVGGFVCVEVVVDCWWFSTFLVLMLGLDTHELPFWSCVTGNYSRNCPDSLILHQCQNILRK